MVEEPVRDPRLLGDVADAAGVVALRREDADGRVEDEAALVGASLVERSVNADSL